jgi:hypothetical protein
VKKYPVDLTAVDFKDFESWRSDFFIPETPEKLWMLNKSIREAYYDMVGENSGSFIGKLMLVKIKLFMEYTRILSVMNLKKLLGEHGYEPVYGPDNFTAKEILDDSIDFKNTSSYTSGGSTRSKFRNFLYNMRVNRTPFYYLMANRSGMKVFNSQPSLESIIYARKNNCSYFYCLPGEWLKGVDKINISSEMKKQIQDMAESIYLSLQKTLEPFGLTIDNRLADFIRLSSIEHLSMAAAEWDILDKKIAKRGPFFHLGSAQCTDFHRLFALINRKHGGHSIGFNHGNDTFSSRDLRMELSIVNEFSTYTEGGAELIRNRDDSMFKPFSDNQPKISSLNTDIYLKTFQKYCKMGLPKEVKKVMVSGYPYDLTENLSFGPPDLIYLDMEYETVKALRDAGFEVIYKPHPEGCASIPAEIFGDGVEVSLESFDQVSEKIDAFVFNYSFTSPFPWTLSTNKPVVLIDSLFFRYHTPEVMDLLKKRCKVIKPHYDDRSRIRYNTDEMVEYLKQKPEEPDTSLLKKYFFPKE